MRLCKIDFRVLTVCLSVCLSVTAMGVVDRIQLGFSMLWSDAQRTKHLHTDPRLRALESTTPLAAALAPNVGTRRTEVLCICVVVLFFCFVFVLCCGFVVLWFCGLFCFLVFFSQSFVVYRRWRCKVLIFFLFSGV